MVERSEGVTADGADDDGVRWDGVGFEYRSDPPVVALHVTDLHLRAGEQVAIVGPSGAGKTTVLNLLGLLDRPTHGRYHLFGHDTSELGEQERAGLRASLIGFVFQTFHLLAQRTSTENVMLGMTYGRVERSERREIAIAALDRVGLAHRRDARCSTLSGGERQRVAIARAICHSPRLLLADEPTGNLDRRIGREILELLSEVMDPSLLQIMVTHDPQVAERFDRVIQIIDGQVTER